MNGSRRQGQIIIMVVPDEYLHTVIAARGERTNVGISMHPVAHDLLGLQSGRILDLDAVAPE